MAVFVMAKAYRAQPAKGRGALGEVWRKPGVSSQEAPPGEAQGVLKVFSNKL